MDSESDLKHLLGIQDSLWLGRIEIDFTKEDLGVGSDGTVYCTPYDGRDVAVKVLHRALIRPRNQGRAAFIRKFGEECKRLRQLTHPAIVSFIGVGQAPNGSPCLVLELMEDSLASRIAATPPDTFLQTLSYLLDAAAGLRYLHWKSIIHRDLKPQNILIVAGSAKISDVGLSRCLHGDGQRVQQLMTRCPGTIYYMAPESLDEGVEYGVVLDIFGMGVIILTMFSNKEPAPKQREVRILSDGQRQVTSELERRAEDLAKLDKDHPAQSLIVDCLQDTPDSRPSAVRLHQCLLDIQQKYTGTDKVVLQSELAEQNAIQEREFETFREANQEDIASLQEALQESQQMQMQSQRRVTTLQTEIEVQQVKIQELKVTVSRLSEATTCSEGIGGAPTQGLLQAAREPPLTTRFIKDVIAKREWMRLPVPPSVQGRGARNPVKTVVHLNELYIAYHMEDDTPARLFKYSMSWTWTEIPLPSDIHNCMALVSGNNKLYMLFSRLPDYKIYVCLMDVSGWMISTESPWEQYYPGVVYHSGALHLVGGKRLDLKTPIARSTTLTADLQKWSSTTATTVSFASSILPAAPAAASDHTITVCQDTMYMTGGFTDDVNDTLPVYRLHSSDSLLTWKKSTQPQTPQEVGCASYHNSLWLAGGWNSGRNTAVRDVLCLQLSTGYVIALPSLPSPRYLPSVTVLNGTLTVAGGGDGKKWLNDIFTLDLTP